MVKALFISLFLHLLIFFVSPLRGANQSLGYTERDLSFFMEEVVPTNYNLKALSELFKTTTSDEIPPPTPPVSQPENKSPTEPTLPSEPSKPYELTPVFQARSEPALAGESKGGGDKNQGAGGKTTPRPLTLEEARAKVKEIEQELENKQLTPSAKSQVNRKTYVELVHERIQANYFIPDTARHEKMKGKVLVRMEVSTKGEILSAEVVKYCDFPILNLAALATVKAAAPFPDISDKVDFKSLTILVPFIYP